MVRGIRGVHSDNKAAVGCWRGGRWGVRSNAAVLFFAVKTSGGSHAVKPCLGESCSRIVQKIKRR